MSTKISKACEPCRIRKTRCNGSHPCQRSACKTSPQNCVYRPKARIRKSLKQQRNSKASTPSELLPPGRSVDSGSAVGAASTIWSEHRDCDKDNEQGAQHEVYHSVTETHLSPKSTDSSQLFYGPSSNFAFLQQVHRGVLSVTRHGPLDKSEGRSGLDTFMQRSIFFGTPPRINPEAIRSSGIQLRTVSQEQAKDFLDAFKMVSHYRLPFYTITELDALFQNLYSPHEPHAIPPQTKATFLAILAIGALSTPHTDLAETLMTEAKREAVIFDDAVTLQMLQLSILLADYQINMGRPNSTYLHLGVACRKAFALGLHIEVTTTRSDDVTLQNHRITLWSLYFYETCQALTLGRRSGLKFGDIACPFPTEPPAIVRLCCIAKILEDTADSIYRRRADSIRQLYATAEGLHSRLRRFAEEHAIASSNVSRSQDPSEAFESLTLHNLYYLAIILIFRPFLVANYAMQVNGGTRDASIMWLRQACRYAVDAAQDSIEFAGDMLISGRICRSFRYQAFFIECSCAVLLYDTLCQPSKYTYNMDYIKKAMQALSCMVADEPVTTAVNSIRRVLETIETSISGNVTGSWPTALDHTVITTQHYENIQFPSLDELTVDGSEKMIFLKGGTDPVSGETNPSAPGLSGTPMDQDWLNPDYFNLNVMTTDLSSYFPMDKSTPLDYPTSKADGSGC